MCFEGAQNVKTSIDKFVGLVVKERNGCPQDKANPLAICHQAK